MISCYHLTVPRPGAQSLLLDDVSVEVARGDFVQITGASGAGKSVLFSILSLRRRVADARCIIAGRNLDRLDEAGMADLRRTIGSRSQRPVLLEQRSVLENLILPLVARGEHDGALERVEELIADSRLEQLAQARAGRLSEAERNLLGLFRALVGSPALVLVDGGLEGLGDLAGDARRALKQAHASGSTIVATARRPAALEDCCTVLMELSDGMLEVGQRIEQPPQAIDGAA
jgi:ABC-type ATPase involved in cell division